MKCINVKMLVVVSSFSCRMFMCGLRVLGEMKEASRLCHAGDFPTFGYLRTATCDRKLYLYSAHGVLSFLQSQTHAIHAQTLVQACVRRSLTSSGATARSELTRLEKDGIKSHMVDQPASKWARDAEYPDEETPSCIRG